MSFTSDVTGGKPIAVLLQSISVVSAINPLVAFYDIHGVKREVLFFYFVPDTTRDYYYCYYCLFISRSKCIPNDKVEVVSSIQNSVQGFISPLFPDPRGAIR
jgi:hypothetical protein